jgi:hypothetical protein
MGGRIHVAYLFSNPAILTRMNCTTIKMRNTSQQIVKNDSPDFSNNNHATVAANITPNVTPPRLHKMISATEIQQQ